MNRILLISTYFGSWPKWFPAFIVSCARNQDVDWLFLTDCQVAGLDFPNIHFISMTMSEFNSISSRALGIRVQKHPYSQLDLRPAYGEILSEFSAGYDFWGHVDVDVIWGRIRHFVTDPTLEECDIFSSRKDCLAGHFTLYRNSPVVNAIYRLHPEWKCIMGEESYHHFDEKGMGIFLKYCFPKDLRGKIRVQWSSALVLDWWDLFCRRSGWEWRNGELYDRSGREHMYIHFMTWKPHMQYVDFKAGEQPERFRINHRGVWSKPTGFPDRLRLLFSFRFLAESYLRYAAWYWVDGNRWSRFLRPRQHAKRDQPKV
ncbi:MAG: hypothetical protein HN341_16715 [Verrucomicrobia bacterium]|jgi:hypothetical protein|nr:hypothetical protein [Verrucomicrobiota bacterium]